MFSEHRAVRIRPAIEDDALGIARVNVRSWQGAYRGIIPDSFLDALEPSSRVERWREALRPPLEGRFTYAAELSPAEDGMPAEIVGFSAGGPERGGFAADGVQYESEIYALYLAPEHQRQGIGRRLVAASVQQLLDQGTKSVVIWALKDNFPARSFYESLGGVMAGEKTIAIGTSNLLDVAYVWPEAGVLLDRAQGLPG